MDISKQLEKDKRVVVCYDPKDLEKKIKIAKKLKVRKIKPVEKDGKLVCRVCGGDLNARADDQDEDAIDKRHNIYYDETTGTMAAVNYFKEGDGPKVISVDGSKSNGEVTEAIMAEL